MSDGAARPSLGTSAARGFAWASVQAAAMRLTSLVGFVVVARFVDPEDYGLAALGGFFVAVLVPLAAAGYSQALVQKASVDATDLDTIFWLGLATSVLLAGLVDAFAWPLSRAFDQPRLVPILLALSSTFVFVAVRTTHHAVLQRELRFRDLAQATVRSSLIATIVAIALAVTGAGVWALVAQTVVAQAGTTYGVIRRSGYRVGRRFSRASFTELFPFSRNYLGVSLLTLANQRVDDVLVAAFLGVQSLGIYAVGYRILTVITDVLSTSASYVALPVLSRVRDEKERLRHVTGVSTRVCAAVSVPVCFFCSAAAPDLVDLAFGKKWAAAAPIMRILCLVGPIEVLLQLDNATLMATGRIQRVLRIGLVNTVVQVGAFLAAVSFGIEWVAASYVLRVYLLAPLTLTAAGHALGQPLRARVAMLVPSFLGGCAILAVAGAASHTVHGHLSNAAAVLSLLVAATIAYVLVMAALAPTDLGDARRLALRALRSST